MLLPLQGTLQHPASCFQCLNTESCTASPHIFSTSVPKWLHGKHPPWKTKPREASPAPPHTPHQFGSDTVALVQLNHTCEQQQTHLWSRVLSCGSHLLCVKWALVPFFHRRSLYEHTFSQIQQECSSPQAYFRLNLDPDCNLTGTAMSLQPTGCCCGRIPCSPPASHW